MGRSRFASSPDTPRRAPPPEPFRLEALPPELIANVLHHTPVSALARLALVNKPLAHMTVPLFGEAGTWTAQTALLPLLASLHSEQADMEPLHSALVFFENSMRTVTISMLCARVHLRLPFRMRSVASPPSSSQSRYTPT